MDTQELIDAMRIIEVSSTDRSSAIRELVEAVDWAKECVLPEDVINAIEEREATAQTIVDLGLAFPHAKIDWSGDFRLVLGRSRIGVEYGTAGESVHLIAMLVVGKVGTPRHLEVLAGVADLLGSYAFREQLIGASHARIIRQLLIEKAGEKPKGKLPPTVIPHQSITLAEHAVGLAQSLSAQAILLSIDHGQSVPWKPLELWAGRLLIVAPSKSDQDEFGRAETHQIGISHASLSRMDRTNLGLLLAAAKGLVNEDSQVVCITGTRGQALDSITVTRPAAHFRAVFKDAKKRFKQSIRPEVILRVLSLAIEIASEGREAHQVGATFVIGDTRQVVQQTQQLVLNPFHGFARRLRNILDPSLAETVKEFALLDGAFIVEADGAIRSAGTYLNAKSAVKNLPSGLGSRHRAAAAITVDSRAVAITVSQSTGTVTLFQDGGIVLTLERAALTRW